MQFNFTSEINTTNKDEFINSLSILNDLGYYNDMLSIIKSSKVEHFDLNYEESLLLGSSFKNILNTKRKEKVILDNILQDNDIDEEEKKCANLYKDKLIKDMRNIGKTTYIIIRSKCIPKAKDDKILMNYWHIIGDIMRYCADTFNEISKKKLQEKSLESYNNALNIVKKLKLPPSSPIVLEIMVNLTVLHRDMDTDLNFAIEMAAQAFRDAIQNMHLLENDEEYSKTINILGLIKDNIINWCEIIGRKNVNALFEIHVNENKMDKFKNIMNNIKT